MPAKAGIQNLDVLHMATEAQIYALCTYVLCTCTLSTCALCTYALCLLSSILYICRDVTTFVKRALQISSFMQNKANFPDDQMNGNKVLTKDYENITNWTLGENKPNTKPIKPNTNPIKAKTNPIQTQNKPNQTQPVVSLPALSAFVLSLSK